MKIAIPCENGEVMQHFGHATEFTVYTIEDIKPIEKETVTFDDTDHEKVAGGLKSRGDDLGNINQAMTFYGGVNWYATTAVKTSLGYEFGYYDQGDAVVERVYGNTVWAQVQVLF